MRDRKSDVQRQVLERKLGRPLASNEVSDHADTDKTNDAPNNLRPMTRSDHSRMHATREQRTLGKLRKTLDRRNTVKLY